MAKCRVDSHLGTDPLSAGIAARIELAADKALNAVGMGTFYLAQASNKRSITLDLKTKPGREILEKLVVRSDVLVENYRPGALAALGLGADAVMALNPRLIYASMSAFGQDGPRASQTGYDMNIQASSGIMAMTGTETVNPLMLGPSAVDYASGTTGALALVSALFQRERTGRGQRIDLAMIDVAIILMGSHLASYLRNGALPSPGQSSRWRPTAATDQGRLSGDGREQSAPAPARMDIARTARIHQADDAGAPRQSRARGEGARRDPADAHRRRMGRPVPGQPRARRARSHLGRGGRRSAARDAQYRPPLR
jgi:crotonobetainyl-CoA:carnitine CoA-transferase CaiB-like acyl-CoA transferase